LLFILALILFVTYLVSTNLPSPSPVWTFWVIVIFLSFLMVWQVGKTENSAAREGIVLCEIFFLGFALYLIFVVTVPYGLFGRDVHHDYYVAKTIMEYGWPIPEQAYIVPHTYSYSEYPAIHILGGVVSNILGIKLFAIEGSFTVTKWLPTIISSCLPLLVFAIVKRMYHNGQVALLASFGSLALYYHLFFHSMFVRETVAFPVYLAFIFLYVVNVTRLRASTAVSSLCILALFALALAHHLTFVMLLIYLTILPIVLYLSNKVGRRVFRWPTPFARLDFTMLMLALVIFFAYTMYIGEGAFGLLAQYIKDLLHPVVITKYVTGERVLRDQTLFYLRMFFAATFALLVLIQILKNRKTTIVWDVLGLALAVGCFVIWVLGFLLEGLQFGTGISRFETFAWFSLMMSAAHAIWHLKYKNVAIYFVAFFVICNVLALPSYVYDRNAEPAYKSGEVSMSYARSDYSAVEWFDGSGVVMGDISVEELLGGLKQVSVVTDIDIFKGDLSQLNAYDWLAVRAEDFKIIGRIIVTQAKPPFPLSADTFDSYETATNLTKVYSNGNVIFYKISEAKR
jgi:hypothetical protein